MLKVMIIMMVGLMLNMIMSSVAWRRSHCPFVLFKTAYDGICLGPMKVQALRTF
jgi:hypothetical protein